MRDSIAGIIVVAPTKGVTKYRKGLVGTVDRICCVFQSYVDPHSEIEIRGKSIMEKLG